MEISPCFGSPTSGSFRTDSGTGPSTTEFRTGIGRMDGKEGKLTLARDWQEFTRRRDM